MNEKEILLGVSGGIAAYKSVTIVSRLVQQGYGVTVVMTDAATQLVASKTFEALSGRPVQNSVFRTNRIHTHIELAREAGLFCIAPATANILAKAAHGIADDLLSTIILSFEGTLLFAPAMNAAMWNKPSVQRNVRQLIDDGALMIGPESGRLSCGETGAGRMTEPEQIVAEIIRLTAFSNPPLSSISTHSS
ncbi:MAG: phosphopantothenoylcysteine decarboxylase [Planctomycetaceae bacterium]|nr:phosphopantothenoylcysteine decarboxylase [Planctomycetaceae bacterium]